MSMYCTKCGHYHEGYNNHHIPLPELEDFIRQDVAVNNINMTNKYIAKHDSKLRKLLGLDIHTWDTKDDVIRYGTKYSWYKCRFCDISRYEKKILSGYD